MRDWMIFGMMLFLVPLAFRNGYVAYLLWGWAGLAAIDSYLYGFMRSIQLAFSAGSRSVGFHSAGR